VVRSGWRGPNPAASVLKETRVVLIASAWSTATLTLATPLLLLGPISRMC
jgi:hypothetical protein